MSAVNDKTFAAVAARMQRWQQLDEAWDDADNRRIAPIVGAADNYRAGTIDLAMFQQLVRDAVLHIGVHMFVAGFAAGSDKSAD